LRTRSPTTRRKQVHWRDAGSDELGDGAGEDHPLVRLRILNGFDVDVAIHPDELLLDELVLAPRVALDVLAEHAAHPTRPPLTTTDLLVRLGRAGAPGFTDEVGRML
jgi:hypothetical protein